MVNFEKINIDITYKEGMQKIMNIGDSDCRNSMRERERVSEKERKKEKE